MKKGAVYLHRKTVYTFQGEAIPAPAPGTYDATKWTPPTHRMYAVVIQDDGIWAIEWGGVDLATGQGAKASLAEATRLLTEFLEVRG